MARILVAIARSFLLFLAMASVTHSDLASDEKECGSQLQVLITCLPYVQGSSLAPVKDCCDGLRQVQLNSPKCLCLLIKDSSNPQLGLTINRTLALRLPEDCKVAANISKCPGLLHISPSSPDARVFRNQNTSSNASAAASAAPAAAATKNSPSKSLGAEIRPRMGLTALGFTVGGAAYLWFCILLWG